MQRDGNKKQSGRAIKKLTGLCLGNSADTLGRQLGRYLYDRSCGLGMVTHEEGDRSWATESGSAEARRETDPCEGPSTNAR
jgi:hypothetical protein